MSDKQDYSEIARYCQSDDPCLTQCQSGNFMAGHLYTCALEVEQLRADKRELVEGLKYLQSTMGNASDVWNHGWMNYPDKPEKSPAEFVRDLITKHGES